MEEVRITAADQNKSALGVNFAQPLVPLSVGGTRLRHSTSKFRGRHDLADLIASCRVQRALIRGTSRRQLREGSQAPSTVAHGPTV